MLVHMAFCYSSFYEAWCILDTKIDTHTVGTYTIPWIVNGAFACEVGMKYILQINGIEFKRIHLLHELYGSLPDKHKKAIIKELNEKYPNFTSDEFNNQILVLSNYFSDFRYFYEHDLVSDLQFFRDWCLAIFKQVNCYPSYELTERKNSEGISFAEFDRKASEIERKMISKCRDNNR